jgi:hypothetical protein
VIGQEGNGKMNETAQVVSFVPSFVEAIDREMAECRKILAERMARWSCAKLKEVVASTDETLYSHPAQTLLEATMKASGKAIRVAEWYIDSQGRCQHKSYAKGNTRKAHIRDMDHIYTRGDLNDTWIEAWIA